MGTAETQSIVNEHGGLYNNYYLAKMNISLRVIMTSIVVNPDYH